MTQEQKNPRDLSDGEISDLIEDPAKIQDHATAIVVIETLESEIAAIQAQLDLAVVRASLRPMSPAAEAWFRRASYAGSLRRRELHRVIQRDRELRGTKGSAVTPPKRDKEAGRIKQERLLLEAQNRKAALQTKHTELMLEHQRLGLERTKLKQLRSLEYHFHQVAMATLPPTLYEQVYKEAETRNKAELGNDKSGSD